MILSRPSLICNHLNRHMPKRSQKSVLLTSWKKIIHSSSRRRSSRSRTWRSNSRPRWPKLVRSSMRYRRVRRNFNRFRKNTTSYRLNSIAWRTTRIRASTSSSRRTCKFRASRMSSVSPSTTSISLLISRKSNSSRGSKLQSPKGQRRPSEELKWLYNCFLLL